MKNKSQSNWWNKQSVKPMKMKPLVDDTKGLVKTAIGGAVALTALGIGLAAFDVATD
jgi:hypothetical protein|tara:strand:- start:3717 stop:3887 length:171 start_codon:yes stop_codon:yes gene_type:complete